MKKRQQVLEEARSLAGIMPTWADLSNALFDPVSGIVSRAFRTETQRRAFRDTEEYREIRSLLREKMNSTGLVRGATPEKSGKFVLRMPKSLHAALENEAFDEGTSLNQLVVTKLALQLSTGTNGRIANLIQAFAETRNGRSADYVIADPEMNRKFLRRCRELALTGTDAELNGELMNARKNSYLANLPKPHSYSPPNMDQFEFASELALRHVQSKIGCSLDQVLCDPDLAKELDGYAARLAPGFTSLDYRWAALRLRKAGRLGKSAKRIAQMPTLEVVGPVESIVVPELPQTPGLYLFATKDVPVFLGNTDDLRNRIQLHMAQSHNHGLPRWLWQPKNDVLGLSMVSLPDLSRSVRQAMETLFVIKYRPVLNFQRHVG